jgi:hypothetical protein
MTIPTKVWNNGIGSGTFETWGGTPKDAQDMIEELVTEMLPSFNASVTFDNWIIFGQASPSDPVLPLVTGNFTAMVGTDVGGSWAGAVELIVVARTQAFGIAKLTLLDAISGDDYSPVLTLSGSLGALCAEWFNDTNGWAGRDNAQPGSFLKMTKNLNQKLRKEYRYD